MEPFKHKMWEVSAPPAPPPYVPPTNLYLGADQTYDMGNWFIKSTCATALDQPNYEGVALHANTITAAVGNGQHVVFSFNLTGSATKYGAALKAGTVNFAGIWGNGDSSQYASFDLVGGTTVAHGAAASEMHDLGGGWWWCQVTVTPASNQLMLVQVADTQGHAAPANWNAAGTETIIAGPFAVT